MIDIKNYADCCGCTACISSCPHRAINVEEDSLGFLYPKVDLAKCTDCGLCDKVCQFHTSYCRYDNFDKPVAYLARLKDLRELAKSQSGGLFYAIALMFVNNGGILYGASFDKSWKVIHLRVDDIIGLEKLRMSKYVQSDMQGIFKSVKDDLINNKKVLFSGTPCQVSGLKSYIPNRLHENLYCIDIICHCVPSPRIWRDYIDYLEAKYKKKIVEVRFRDKRFGWRGATESFLFDDDSVKFRDTSNTLFFDLLSIRDSCTKCPYTNLQRVGDLTTGDFWGLPKESIYNDNKGVSLALVNSDKGKDMIFQISDSCIIEATAHFTDKQPQLKTPVKFNPLRKKFLKDYNERGFKYVAYRYSDCGWRYKSRIFKSRIKSKIRKLLKQLRVHCF